MVEVAGGLRKLPVNKVKKNEPMVGLEPTALASTKEVGKLRAAITPHRPTKDIFFNILYSFISLSAHAKPTSVYQSTYVIHKTTHQGVSI